MLYKGELRTRNNYSVIYAFIVVFRGQENQFAGTQTYHLF